jgi:tetratricopeptide (TPR) repeat protein
MIKYLLMVVLLTLSCISAERKEARVLYEKASQENDDEKKKIYYKEILDKYPTTEYGKFSLIWDLLKQGKFDEAEKLSNDLIKENPEFEAGYYALGVTKTIKKEYTDAIQLFDKALTSEFTPNKKRIHYSRAMTYYQKDDVNMQNHHEIKKGLDIFLEGNPTKDPKVYFVRGTARANLTPDDTSYCDDFKIAYENNTDNSLPDDIFTKVREVCGQFTVYSPKWYSFTEDCKEFDNAAVTRLIDVLCNIKEYKNDILILTCSANTLLDRLDKAKGKKPKGNKKIIGAVERTFISKLKMCQDAVKGSKLE